MSRRHKEHPHAELLCITCDRFIHKLGIMRHRAMHRDKKERCEIIYTDGTRKIHDYREVK